MSIIAAATVLTPLISEIVGLFKKVDANEIPLKQAEADLEKILNERMSILANLLQGQLDINRTEAEAGRLGWRNWLGKGLTIAALYGLLAEPLLRSLLALSTLAGVPLDSIQAVNSLLPEFNWEVIMPLLGGLLGLYGMRGMERVSHNKVAANFNKELFYDILRKGYGGTLSEPNFKLIEKALQNAGLR